MTVSELISKLQTMPQDAQVMGYSHYDEGDIAFKKVKLTNLEGYFNEYYFQADSQISYDFKANKWIMYGTEDENGKYVTKLCDGVENRAIVVLE